MATTQTPTTRGGQAVRAGQTFDYEDSRTTFRLQTALEVLKALGIEATHVEHSEKCICNPKNKHNQVFGFNYHCDNDCPRIRSTRPSWPEWVDGSVFDEAYSLASKVARDRGTYNRTVAA